MKSLSDNEIDFNYRRLENYYDILTKINNYGTMLDKQLSQEVRGALINEINILKQDLEDYRKLIFKLNSVLPRVIYLKYIEGYTLEEAADDIGYSLNYVATIHAYFTKKLKERGINI